MAKQGKGGSLLVEHEGPTILIRHPAQTPGTEPLVRLRSIEDAACLAGLLTNGARHLMGVEPVAQAVLAVVMNVQKVPDRCPYHVSALVYDTPEQSRVLVSRDSQDLFAVSGAGAEALALKIADEIRKVQSLDPAAVKAWYAANG